jgi:hypothetical protein
MSETETPRDDDTGQFSPSTDGLFGQEAELAKAGFKPMADSPQPEAEEFKSPRDAADELSASRSTAPVVEVGYHKMADGERVDGAEAVTIERAARDLTAYRGDVQRYVEGADFSAVAEIIDTARAEVLKGRPQDADAYGLDAKEVEANAAKAKLTEAKPAESADAAPEPAVDGLDPEVAKALQHPQVRQAIEEELGKAEATKQNYAQALNTAHQYAQAMLVEHLPELADLAPEQWAPAIGIINQSDPQRVARAMGVLQRVDNLQKATTQWQQHQAVEQQQRVEAWAKDQAVKYDEWAAKEGVKPSEIAPVAVEYLKDIGIGQDELGELFKAHPILRAAAFQQMLTDAARYRGIMKAKAAVAAKSVPPVQRPGAAAARSSRGAEDIQSLARTFKSSGKVNDAVKLLMARRTAAKG